VRSAFARSEAGIVGSNPILSMDVLCVWSYSVFVLSLVLLADLPSKEIRELNKSRAGIAQHV
jgi:hypothetical protein